MGEWSAHTGNVNNTMTQQANGSEITQYSQGSSIAIRDLDDVRRVSLIFVESGMFKSDRNLTAKQKMYQAGVKIMAATEFGIGPFAAMKGINIIGGNAEMSSNLMAGKVKAHPKYDYRVKQWDNEQCVLDFYEIMKPGAPREDWDHLGDSSFTLDDARQAGLLTGNYVKFPRNMLFARAMSNGVRIHCPDIFYGAPVYTEGEISGGDFQEQAGPAEPVRVAADVQPDAPDEGSQEAQETEGGEYAQQQTASLFDELDEHDPVEQLKILSDALGRPVTEYEHLGAEALQTAQEYLRELIEAKRQDGQEAPDDGEASEPPVDPLLALTDDELRQTIQRQFSDANLNGRGQKAITKQATNKLLGTEKLDRDNLLKLTRYMETVLAGMVDTHDQWFVAEPALPGVGKGPAS